MSYAIFDLELEEPPASVYSGRSKDGSIRWVVRCEMCGHRTTPRPLLSTAIRDEKSHARGHYAAMLALRVTRESAA